MKAVISFGYKRFVVPLDDGLKMMQLLHEAEVYDTAYEDQGQVSYIGNAGHTMDIALNLLSDDDYAVAKMRGQKPEGK